MRLAPRPFLATLDVWRSPRGGVAAVLGRQQARLAEQIWFARQNSPLYRRLYAGLSEDQVDLSELPPVSKPLLMANFDDLVTDRTVSRAGVDGFLADPTLVGRRFNGRYAVLSTSGVTGEPGIFLHDARAVAVYRALTFARGWLPRLERGTLGPLLRQGNRVAVVVSTGGHYGGASIMEAARREHPWPFNRVRVFSALGPLAALCQALNEFQPAQLIAYASVLALLADEQAAGRLAIRPATVASGGEWLDPRVRQQVARAFGCSVRENYGVSEFPPLAWDCARQRLHLCADWAVLEAVDEAYRPVPPGQLSYTTLLTNLANRVQPLIRYELGDRVRFVESPCACGSPLPVVEVEGRRDETLLLRATSGQIVPVLPSSMRRVPREPPGVRRVQVIQTSPVALRVRLEAVAGVDEQTVWLAVQARLRAFLVSRGLPNVEVERDPERPAPHPISGKYLQVWAESGSVGD